MSQEAIPLGGVSAKKYAAICLALGMARGGLYSALQGDFDEVKRIRDLTSTAAIAAALGCTEGDLAIDWDEHLSYSEKSRIEGFGA